MFMLFTDTLRQAQKSSSLSLSKGATNKHKHELGTCTKQLPDR